MSANLVVDLFNTCQMAFSFRSGILSGETAVRIGDIVDMLSADTNTQLFVVGRSTGSGPLLVGVQTSPDTTSGNFTNPISGLSQFPGAFRSGGYLIIGSGPATDTRLGIFGSGVSGQIIQSGFVAASHFQRPHRYARVIIGSGLYDGYLQAGFIGNLRTTGSGGGATQSPGSGAVSV